MKSRAFKRGNAEVEANLTPMIDVTFLLIVFFVLVSQITEIENVDMELPAPDDPATVKADDDSRAVINVVPGEGGDVEHYKIGTRFFDASPRGIDAMTDHLAGLFTATPGLHVNLRADRRTEYRHVEPAMQAVATAAARAGGEAFTPRVNLVVIGEDI